MTRIWKLFEDDRGATAIEYGLIAALIAVSIMGALNMFANETVGMWNDVATTLNAAVGS